MSNNKPLISVIVPVYNVEQYLNKCIDSIINQTYKNLEIILVNDGSTDNSSIICDEYANKDRRIKVIHKSNGGLSDARNAGIDAAKGKYIGFIDSDDWVEIDMYSKLYSIASKENVDIAQCDFIRTYSEDEKIYNNTNEVIKLYTGIEMLEQLYKNKYVKNILIWNKIYKRELFDNIRFPKGKIHEDEFTTHKLFFISKRVVDINLPMVYYRQREGSITNSKFNIKRLEVIEAFKDRIEFFNKNKLYNLSKKTEWHMCATLKGTYLNVYKSDIQNRKQILKLLKEDMLVNYFNFMRNPYIEIKSKITLTICILNGRIYYGLFNIMKNSMNV